VKLRPLFIFILRLSSFDSMSKLVVILGFLVSFAAGVTFAWRVLPPRANVMAPGAAGGPATGPSATAPGDPDGGRRGGDRDRGGWLTEVLKLTPGQQEQMKAIWSEAAQHGRREREDRRQALRKDRDEAISKLMTDNGLKDEFDWIYATYARRVADLDAEWRAKFDSAVEKTKAMLNAEQRAKYEEILSRHAAPTFGGDRGGPGGPQPGGWDRGGDRYPGRRPETRATSRPGRPDPQTSRTPNP
jgi:uncharacterized membrane protein